MLMGHKLLPSEGDKSVLGQVRDQASLLPVSVVTSGQAYGCPGKPCLYCAAGVSPICPDAIGVIHVPQVKDRNAQRLLRHLIRRNPAAR